MFTNNFKYSTAKPSDETEIVEFLQTNFRGEEILTVLLNLSRDECQTLFTDIVRDCLKIDGTSFIVRDNQEMIAVRVNSIECRHTLEDNLGLNF
jgi:hypothetical protein